MKKTLSFMVMAFALLFAQCRKPEVKFPTPSAADEGTTVSMTVTAGPGSKTDITTAGVITWSTGDKLYVGYNNTYVGYLTLESGSGTPTGTFSGDVTLTGIPEGIPQTFHFFYLGSDDHTASLKKGVSTTVDVDFSSQNIYADVNNKLVSASKHHVGYGSANGTVSGGFVTGINVTMVSKVALARFSFTDGTNPYTDELTLSGDHIYNSMTVGFGGTFTGAKPGDGKINLTNTTTPEKYVMLVPAGAGSATLNFGGEYEGATTLAQGIEANKYYGQGGPIEVVLTKVPVHVTGVSLNKSTLSLAAGATETLTATVTPETADNKNVTWSSSNGSVATVADGTVTAVAAGTATITVTTEDGGMTATCMVTVTAQAPTIGPFTVSSGVTVSFSPGNLYWDGSAFHFEANQWSFADTWDPSHVSHFYWSKSTDVAVAEGYEDYEASTEDNFFTNADETTVDPDFQVNGETFPNTWRTLSYAEWNYLLDTRTNASSLRAWVTLKITETVSVPGLVILPDGSTVTASNVTTTAVVASSGAVFLPAAGCRYGTFVYNVGSYGYYWSSTPYEDYEDDAYIMYFDSGNVGTGNGSRLNGYAVRLVR